MINITYLIIIYLFVIGTIFGSFYNVVAHRLPVGKSIVYPPSRCDNCNHRLTFIELIPIFSYLIQKGKCKKCGVKITSIHLIFEIMVGILFSFSFIVFGFDFQTILALIVVSVLSIVIISDLNYMVILDEVLITGALATIISVLIFKDFSMLLSMFFSSFICFLIMYCIKLFGNFLYKKESMGDGDIKLIAYIGFNLGLINGIGSIFLGSIIALPISYFFMKKGHKIIPFGPFLSIAAMILMFTQFDVISLFIR
ncbi:MAG: prepilin peptidase [Mycoplasmatota bacterium]